MRRVTPKCDIGGKEHFGGGPGADRLADFLNYCRYSVSDDRIFGGSGPDLIIDYYGVNLLKGGGSNDSITGSYVAGVTSANGFCELVPDGADRIYGQAGDDDLSGNLGNDTIYGGPGNDTIRAREDAPTDPGEDWVSADDGNDTIYARDGRFDEIRCGPGRDKVFYDENIDTVGGGCEVLNPTKR